MTLDRQHINMDHDARGYYTVFYVLLLFLGGLPIETRAEFSVRLNATTNYVARGYSKSDDDAALQANFDFQHPGGFYLGTWISSVDFADSLTRNPAKVEFIPYLGWTFSLSDTWRLDTQVNRYVYDGKIFGHTSDYNEFYLLFHYRDLATARFSFSENGYDQGHASADYELTGRYPLTDSIEFSTSFGYSQTRQVIEYDYFYWNSGITWFSQYATFDFRYMDAYEIQDHPENEILNPWPYDPETLDATFVFSISIGF